MACSTVGCNLSAYCRSQTQISSPDYNPLILYYKGQSYCRSNNFGLRSSNTVKGNFVVYASNGPPDINVPPRAPLATKPSSDSLIDQILRLMTVMVPFLSGKLRPLWIFKGNR
ncbi:hypothetical protein PHJA_001120300 [Phtheirospermum japonicum]|uniref:Uncharacterized protein n=1 Tax=Phtheirospermum japonicum TaxID=374723 RepID=A0A830C304_9LAMI|nr:hypothetical protein PHJA_001120300 [Phtheirospermum japonicum]